MMYSISITSGKGGVGKSTLSANFAVTLQNQGHRVLMLDGDLGVSNLEIILGANPKYNILDLLQNRCTARDLLTPTASGVTVISGGNGLVELQRLNARDRIVFLDLISQVEHLYDYLIVDTAPGINDNVLYLANSTQDTVIVLTPDPSSFTDSYALIKVLNQEFRQTRFSILLNQVNNQEEGERLFSRFEETVEKFLDVRLIYRGSIQRTESFRRHTLHREVICQVDPKSLSARQIEQVCEEITKKPEYIRDGLQLNWSQYYGISYC